MAEIANWVQETTTTQGLGDITLVPSVDPSITRFRDAFGPATVFYSIKNGENRESGQGFFDGVSTLERTTVDSTFVNGTYNKANPTKINLQGGSVVSCTFNAKAYEILRDTVPAHSHPASGITFDGLPSGLGSPDVQSAIDKVALRGKYAEVSANSTILGGDISIISVGGVIRAQEGIGLIANAYTSPEAPSFTEVSWSTQDVSFDISDPAGVVSIFIDSLGVLQSKQGLLSASENRDNILLGIAVYEAGSVIGTVDGRRYLNIAATTLFDYINFIGISKVAKGFNVNEIPISFNVFVDTGKLFSIGVNANADIKNPNIKDYAAIGDSNNPAVFDVRLRDGTKFLSAQTDVPKFWDENGVGTALAGNDASIGYFYMSIDAKLNYQLGQQKYKNGKTAIGLLVSDRSNHAAYSGSEVSFLIAQVYLANDALDFEDEDLAGIVGTNDGKPVQVQTSSLEVESSFTGTHSRNTLVSRDGWLGYALVDSQESPAPQETSKQSQFVVDGQNLSPINDLVVELVHLYTMTVSGYTKELKINLRNVTSSIVSKISIRNETTGDEHNYSGPILVPGEFVTVSTDALFVNAGDVIRVSLFLFDSFVFFNDKWITQLTTGTPVNNGIAFDSFSATSIISIDRNGGSGLNRKGALDNADIGSIIAIAEEAHSSNRIIVRVDAIDASPSTSTKYTVTLLYKSSNLIRVNKRIIFEIHDSSTTNVGYSRSSGLLSGAQPEFATISSEIYLSGVKGSNVDDAYGIGLVFQPAYISPDYKIIGKGGL